MRSAPRPILRNMPFAVVVPIAVTPRVAFAVMCGGTRGPVRIVILLMLLGQLGARAGIGFGSFTFFGGAGDLDSNG